MEVDLKLQQDDGKLRFNPSSYRKLVGSLKYLTITWLDIWQFSQFMQAPHHPHLIVVRRILHYLMVLLVTSYSFLLGLFYSWVIVMRIELVVLTLVQLLVGPCFLVMPLFLRRVRDRVSKSSTESKYHAMSFICS